MRSRWFFTTATGSKQANFSNDFYRVHARTRTGQAGAGRHLGVRASLEQGRKREREMNLISHILVDVWCEPPLLSPTTVDAVDSCSFGSGISNS